MKSSRKIIDVEIMRYLPLFIGLYPSPNNVPDGYEYIVNNSESDSYIVTLYDGKFLFGYVSKIDLFSELPTLLIKEKALLVAKHFNCFIGQKLNKTELSLYYTYSDSHFVCLRLYR